MSISNLVVQPDAAYLLTDTAWLKSDGRILCFAPKVIHFPEQCAAVSCCGQQGFAAIDVVEEYHRSGKQFSFDGFLGTVRDIYALKGYDEAEHAMIWTAAYYSKSHERPFGFSFTTHPSGGGDGYEPWRWYPKTSLILPFVQPSAVFGAGTSRVRLSDPKQFDPLNDFMKFAHQQREHRYEGGWRGVGGEVFLTRAGSGGLRHWNLHDFGDREGDVIGDGERAA